MQRLRESHSSNRSLAPLKRELAQLQALTLALTLTLALALTLTLTLTP